MCSSTSVRAARQGIAMRVVLSFLSNMAGTAVAEIEVPSVENPEIANFSLESRSEYNPEAPV